MSAFDAFAADLATHLSLETGWAWQVDGTALVVAARGFVLDLRSLWHMAQHGVSTDHLAQGLLAGLQTGSLADSPERLRIQVAPAPTDGCIAFPLHPTLWLRVVLDLPLRTQGLPWDDVDDPFALLPEALSLTLRAPDRLGLLYAGGVVAHYQARTALDAAVAYALLADGALVAALGSEHAMVLQTAALDGGMAPFQALMRGAAAAHALPPPPVWAFRQGTLVAVLSPNP